MLLIYSVATYITVFGKVFGGFTCFDFKRLKSYILGSKSEKINVRGGHFVVGLILDSLAVLFALYFKTDDFTGF